VIHAREKEGRKPDVNINENSDYQRVVQKLKIDVCKLLKNKDLKNAIFKIREIALN